MNKSVNFTGIKRSIFESEKKDAGRDRKQEEIKRSDPLKILLDPDEVRSPFEVKDGKKFLQNPFGEKKGRSGVEVAECKSELRSSTDKDKATRKVGRSEVPERFPEEEASRKASGVKNDEQAQNLSLNNKSFIEAITSEKARRIAEDQSSRKASPQRNQEEVKLTKSDYRKIHINEILKGHAQKLQDNSSKTFVQAKEKPPQGITELLIKVKNVEKKEAEKENEEFKKKKISLFFRGKGNPMTEEKPKRGDGEKRRESSVKNRIVTDKQEAKETAIGESGRKTKEGNEPSGKRFKVDEENESKSGEENAERKKVRSEEKTKKIVSNKWIGYRQSRELETRLQGSWENNLFFREVEDAVEDKANEAESKGERRPPPYADRVSLLRNSSRDDKKEEKDSDAEEDRTKPDSTKVQRIDDCLTRSFPLSLSIIKDPNLNENILKPKVTRSAELRDLVNQAVKEHKIFCIFDNHWYIVRPVREELLNRGWLEVIPDRRLIPRRRPPPAGPLLEREKNTERNCNTIEAILTAKEIFVNELEETVAKSPSLRWSTERPKLSLVPVSTSKKASDVSLKESNSSFRIIPPTADRKKNNSEIRDFVAKCQSVASKNVEKEKFSKVATKEKLNEKKGKKSKEEGGGATKRSKSKSGEKPGNVSELAPLSRGLQTILDTVNDHRKAIHKALRESYEKRPGEEEEEKPSNGAGEQEEKDEEEREEAEEGPRVIFKENEAKVISKIIQATNAKIHFMWLSIKPAIHLKCFNYSPEIINKFQKTSFCTKIGLWNHLNNIQWYAHEVHFPAKSPRMYNTGEADDLQAFFQDFQMTACIGMLKWLADTFFDRGIKAVQTKKGKVPLRAFEFAIKQCERYMRFKDNEDLSIVEEPKVLQEEWNTFLQWFYTITNDHGKLQESSSAQLMVLYTRAVETLRIMRKHWPEMDIDGRLNIWIMKPYCASCGRGIFMTNNVYYIGQHSKYIVQKYIEKPLLIYNTKFDIRQWFMVTKLTPLEIWMYKECYLRFCTQPFALRNLHESVHLSNNSVQRKYVDRYDQDLSNQNMWDSQTFQMYLNTIGHPNAWNDIIYPGMRDAIVSIMLSAQDTFDGPRRSWFEVYGADFMLSANVKDGPWLIEINENPAMDPSTKVTARLCPQMLRDVIKVVVDKRTNKNASTGQWELIYRQNYSPSFATVDLDVKGRKIARVPTSMKIGFSGNPSADYEVIKGLDADKSGVPEPGGTTAHKEPTPEPKKLDPLFVLKKEHEKFRQNCPIENARDVIDRVLQYGGGKSSKSGKSSPEKFWSDSLSSESHGLVRQASKLPKTLVTLQNSPEKLTNLLGTVEKENQDRLTVALGKSDGRHRSRTEGKSNENDIFKFTKFYKV